ncbi:MAG: glycosyltransferase, partial [Candidatus Micrarchaeota archaeon]
FFFSFSFPLLIMNKLVSVVIPALNEAKNIRQCLRSVKEQSYSGSFEIIVCDGFSKDDTAKLAKKEGCRVVFERRHTIAAGRQTGAKAANGDILVFCDADGIAEKTWLAALVKPFEDGRVVSTHGNLFMSDANAFDEFFCRIIFPLYFRLLNALGVPSGAGSNLAVRTKAFRKIGGFDTSLVTGEDLMLQKKLRPFGKIVFVPSAKVRVSKRRVLKWGYLGFASFHISNWMRVALGGKPKEDYEQVR